MEQVDMHAGVRVLARRKLHSHDRKFLEAYSCIVGTGMNPTSEMKAKVKEILGNREPANGWLEPIQELNVIHIEQEIKGCRDPFTCGGGLLIPLRDLPGDTEELRIYVTQ